MNAIEFVNGLSDRECFEILQDYKFLEYNGWVGNGPIRDYAQAMDDGIGSFSMASLMDILVKTVHRHLANKYLEDKYGTQ